MLPSEVVFSYAGEMNNANLNHILATIEHKMLALGEKQPFVKKLNNILIECCQNVFHHAEKFEGTDTSTFLPTLIVTHSGGDYFITIRNLVTQAVAERLMVYIEKVNQMSKDELRDYYKDVLTNGLISEKGGGGLGILNIVRKSKNNKLIYNFDEADLSGYYYFNMSIPV